MLMYFRRSILIRASLKYALNDVCEGGGGKRGYGGRRGVRFQQKRGWPVAVGKRPFFIRVHINNGACALKAVASARATTINETTRPKCIFMNQFEYTTHARTRTHTHTHTHTHTKIKFNCPIL